MDFRLDDDQRAFADMAQGLFGDFCGDEQLRAHDVSDAPFMEALWQECVKAGLHAMLIPEDDGGLGLGLTELAAVLEQQGRALAQVPLWETQVAAAALARFVPAAERASVLAEVLAGQQMLTLSLAALSASRGAALRLRREEAREGWQLDGQAPAVPLGAVAQQALLAAEADDGSVRLVWLDLRQAAVGRVEGRSQHHQQVADLVVTGLRLADAAVLPAAATRWVEQRAIACAAALQLGVTQEQLRRTVAYVSERRQFDRVIGSFQMVAGQMADGYIATEALRSLLWQLAFRLDAGRDAQAQAYATRAQANDLGHRAGHMAQHVHGGIGVDLTYPIHRFLYWSRAIGTALGGTEHHLAQLGDWLADHDTLGWKYDLPEDESHDATL